MRVVLGHRRALEQEAVDLGAIWDSGAGPASNPGDWWLSLPVGVPQSNRDKASDSDSPTPWSGAVSQDLTDADGNRMIELGSLVVRIGTNNLSNAGTRPALPNDAGSISIEHVDGGSKITMKSDGSILIQGKAITVDSQGSDLQITTGGGGLTLDSGSGDLTINANNVKVSVQGTMDVG